MNRQHTFAVVLAAVALLWSVDAKAQGHGGRACDPCYDVAAVETVEGVVEDVAYVTPVRGGGRGAGVHVTLKKGDEALQVLLGPQWYLSEQGKAFEKGEQVTVVGSRVTVDGAPALIAREVTRGDTTLVLRDDQGIPAWRGWRRAGQGRGPGMGAARGPGRGQGGPGRGAGWRRCCG